MPSKPQDEPLHPITVRIRRDVHARAAAVSVVTGRTYRDLVESAMDAYLGRLKLTPDQQRKVRALLD